MKHLFHLSLAVVTLSITTAALHAEEPRITRESIEWCNVWIPDANGTKLPRVLLIGDSITGGYGQQVADVLKGKASVARLTTSKSIGDPALLAEVALVLEQCRFDVVHFNNGLHGWGYSEDEYQKHFPELVATIRKHAPKAKMIWATTTPMRQSGKLNVIAEGTKRVLARNKIAEEIVTKDGIAVNDLYGLVKDHPDYWSNDGVHFNGKGVAVEADQVAKRIMENSTCSSAKQGKDQENDAIPLARAAEDQDTALKLAKSHDLPALERADSVVIDHVLPVKKSVRVSDVASLARLRAALVVRDRPGERRP